MRGAQLPPREARERVRAASDALAALLDLITAEAAVNESPQPPSAAPISTLRPPSRRGDDVCVERTVCLSTAARGGPLRVAVEAPRTCPDCAGEGGVPADVVVCRSCGGAGETLRVGGAAPQLRERRPLPVAPGWAPCEEPRRRRSPRAGACPACAGAGGILTRPCRRCDGAGLIAGRREGRVELPAGAATDGQTVRVRGAGGAGVRGGAPGDLLVTLRLSCPDGLRCRGADLVSDLDVAGSLLALGTTAEVETALGGWHSLAVPAGTQDGAELRVRGAGMRRAEGGRGDHVFVVRASVPVPSAGGGEVRVLAKRLSVLFKRDGGVGE